jgi:hypothetical protein
MRDQNSKKSREGKMRNRVLWSSLAVFSSLLLLSVPASADQIVLGGSSIGTVTISCPGGMEACSMSLTTGNLGATSSSTSFESPTGTFFSAGSYNFTGGPSTLQSTNGGTTYNMSGAPWGFTFTDKLGDSLTADADWKTFFSANQFGFQVGELNFSTLSIQCAVKVFCTDFSNGGAIDVTLAGITTDLTPLWLSKNGGTEGNISIESGSITPTTAVPEPGSLALLGSGFIALAGYGRLRFRKS